MVFGFPIFRLDWMTLNVIIRFHFLKERFLGMKSSYKDLYTVISHGQPSTVALDKKIWS